MLQFQMRKSVATRTHLSSVLIHRHIKSSHDFHLDLHVYYNCQLQMRFLGDRFASEATTANPHRSAGKPEENGGNRKPAETC